MGILKTTKDFILERDLKIIYFDNKINIVNYKKITGFDSNKIIVDCDSKLIIISGNNLVITKLLLDELLIGGNIEKLEFR